MFYSGTGKACKPSFIHQPVRAKRPYVLSHESNSTSVEVFVTFSTYRAYYGNFKLSKKYSHEVLCVYEYYTVAKTQYFMPLTQRLFLQENTFLSVKAAFL